MRLAARFLFSLVFSSGDTSVMRDVHQEISFFKDNKRCLFCMTIRYDKKIKFRNKMIAIETHLYIHTSVNKVCEDNRTCYENFIIDEFLRT